MTDGRGDEPPSTGDTRRHDRDAGPLLSVSGLEKHYPIREGLLRREVGRVRAVDGVSFDVHPGEAFGLVGESGCGKSTTALTALRLEEPTGGEIRFDGADVRAFDDDELRRFRRRAQLVLQDPDTAFNPRMTVGEAVGEPLRVHGLDDAARRREVVADTLERVGLSADAVDAYPHEFSGGEKQRIALARSLVLNPDLLVADEPVSALDGRTKTAVLDLLETLRRQFGVAVLLISHDVDLVRRFCDRVAVMYLGEVVERGPSEAVFADPHHPYTRVLASSVPSLDPRAARQEVGVETLSAELPDAADVPSGCRFHPRCPAIIPPEGVDLPREEWLGVVRLRFRLDREGTDPTAFKTALAADASDAHAGPDAVDVREAVGLPETLADPTVDEALTDAAAAVDTGDLAAARDRLAAVTESVCERAVPDPVDVAVDRRVACHRYDDRAPGDPLAGERGE